MRGDIVVVMNKLPRQEPADEDSEITIPPEQLAPLKNILEINAVMKEFRAWEAANPASTQKKDDETS